MVVLSRGRSKNKVTLFVKVGANDRWLEAGIRKRYIFSCHTMSTTPKAADFFPPRRYLRHMLIMGSYIVNAWNLLQEALHVLPSHEQHGVTHLIHR